jgi:hypothetical protein
VVDYRIPGKGFYLMSNWLATRMAHGVLGLGCTMPYIIITVRVPHGVDLIAKMKEIAARRDAAAAFA